VVATKLDATTDRAKLDELKKFCKKRGLEFHAISAAAGEGVKELVRGIADELDRIPKEALEEEEVEVENSAPVSDEEYVDAEADEGDEEQGEEGAASGRNS
jgi:GTP-binding protein